MISAFLSKVVPSGLITIVIPEKRRDATVMRHSVFDNAESAENLIAKCVLSGTDCYFGLGTLKERHVIVDGKKRVRVASNIDSLKSLFVDIDIDPKNQSKYATQKEAIGALHVFCDKYTLPQPLIVSSGVGIHAYWPLTKAIPVDAWKPIAAAFKQLLIKSGVLIDPVRTADPSSILRVPGTKNSKNGATVRILEDQEELPAKGFGKKVVDLSRQLGLSTVNRRSQGQSTIPQHLNDFQQSNITLNYDPSNIDKIISNCSQLEHIAQTGGTTEPLWHAALVLARHTTEPERAARLLSENYPKFSEQELRSKMITVADGGADPTTCERFKLLDPDHCKGCQHFVTSPIQLGTDRFNKVEIPSDDPEDEPITIQAPQDFILRDTSVWAKRVEQKPIQILNCSLTPVKEIRRFDGNGSTTFWLSKQANESPKTLEIESRDMTNETRLVEYLGNKGIYVSPRYKQKVADYMSAYIASLQNETKSQKLITRMGWNEDRTAFALGTTLYRKDGRKTIHLLDNKVSTSDRVKSVHPAGTLDDWVKMMDFYDMDEDSPHRVLTYSSFGAPLFHMTGHHGATVFVSGVTGCGKTTTLRAVNSIWGNPEGLEINGTTSGMTQNAIPPILDSLNSIPVVMDDMTNWDPRVFTDVVLNVSQGRGKDRSNRVGGLVQSTSSWSTIAFASSNSDAYSMLYGNKGNSSAEAMRILQIKMSQSFAHSKQDADAFIELMRSSYGTASHEFIAYVVTHYDEVRRAVRSAMELIDKKINASSSERFWSAVIACALVGGTIAKKLGLLPYYPVMDDIKGWAIPHLISTRSMVMQHAGTAEDIISDYLNERRSTTITATDSKGVVRVLTANIPRDGINVRVEMDEKVAHIRTSDLRAYCRVRGHDIAMIRAALKDNKILVREDYKVTINKGLDDEAANRVNCWCINIEKLNH